MRYRPSMLEQLEGCPRFEYSEDSDDDAAEEGRLLHDCVAKETTDGLDEEQRVAVEHCIEFKKSLPRPEAYAVYHEYAFDGGGTADYVCVRGSTADLVDWKFGRIPVTEAENNPQVQAYVEKAFATWPTVDTVEAAVFCPRQESMSAATYRRSDIPRIQARIALIAARREDPTSKETPTEKSCRRCGRKAVCPALSEVASTVCAARGMVLPAEYDPGKMVSPVDRARAQILSYILEDWCTQVRKANAEAVLKSGVKIPGFEVRTRQGGVNLNNVSTAFSVLAETYSIMPVEMLDSCKVSFTKLVDVVHAILNGGGKRVSKDAVKTDIMEKLAEHISRNDQVVYLQRVKGHTDEEIIHGKC